MSCSGKGGGAPMMDCADVMAKLWDYLDGALDDAAVAGIRAHLDACGHCLPHAEYGEAFLRAVAGLKRQAPASDVTAGLRSKVLDRLRAEGFEEEPAA